MPSNKHLGMLIAASMTAGMVFSSCTGGRRATHVSLIDHATAVRTDDAMELVVGVDTAGKLTLNQIEIGTIADPTVLTEKLEAIFEDRRRSQIDETEIRIELSGEVAFDDVHALIESIRLLRPSRIDVMTR